MNDDQTTPTVLFCTRCGAPSVRQHVQAMSDDDTCEACGGGSWQPAGAPPVVMYALSAQDRDWLRSISVSSD